MAGTQVHAHATGSPRRLRRVNSSRRARWTTATRPEGRHAIARAIRAISVRLAALALVPRSHLPALAHVAPALLPLRLLLAATTSPSKAVEHERCRTGGIRLGAFWKSYSRHSRHYGKAKSREVVVEGGDHMEMLPLHDRETGRVGERWRLICVTDDNLARTALVAFSHADHTDFARDHASEESRGDIAPQLVEQQGVCLGDDEVRGKQLIPCRASLSMRAIASSWWLSLLLMSAKNAELSTNTRLMDAARQESRRRCSHPCAWRCRLAPRSCPLPQARTSCLPA